MKTIIDKIKESLEASKLLISVALFLLCTCFVSPVMAAERFSPIAINAELDNFEKRLSSNQLNVSFILARVLNEARIIKREGENFRSTAEIFRNNNSNNNDSSAVSNSAIIPPGTRADTIIVINQNDGDSYAIHR